jgi:nucleoside 2-deoxyribosyltransferase
MSKDNSKCIVCNSNGAYFERVSNYNLYLFECENCGRFIISPNKKNINKDIYAHFLYHNDRNTLPLDENYCLYFIGEKTTYDILLNDYPFSLLLSDELIGAWYPKNLPEKSDYILTALEKNTEYHGQFLNINRENIISLFFIDRFSDVNDLPENEISIQIKYMSDYMTSQNLLKIGHGCIAILPEGWNRITELHKNDTNNKQAFIAMSFSPDMKNIQNKIEEGIIAAGYFPLAMNEYEHNKQVVPEILYQIKRSKFLIAEFSTYNNGAYYEAGYAAGLGKEVIHICNKKKFKKKGHFDIKQKLSILYENEEEIPAALQKRIEATIGRG